MRPLDFGPIAVFEAFLRRLRHGRGAQGPLHLVLDHHRSHRAAASLRLARELGINPVEHLWREPKGRMAANRQFKAINDERRQGGVAAGFNPTANLP